MSYCHTFAGYTSNTDLFMHRRVEAVIRDEISFGNCMVFDCNDNDTSDAIDISLGHSLDVNTNGIPDECSTSIGACLDPSWSCAANWDLAGKYPNDLDPINGVSGVFAMSADNSSRQDVAVPTRLALLIR
jgi:hypothetical protein